MKVRFHYQYPIDIDIDTDKNVDVYIDSFSISPVPRGHIRIVILEEPKRGQAFNLVQEYRDCYTHVLTYQDEILKTNSKAILFHCPNSWIKDYAFPDKKFSVSTVVGGKVDPVMEGYALRHELWHKRDQIAIPKAFYLSGSAVHSHRFVPWNGADYTNQLVLGASKEPLFNSMFHICIENTSIKNYFSEKIIDCFQTKTVPIYYGCKNISEYFNVEGMFIADSIEDMVGICNSLTEKMYYNRISAMEQNLIWSNEWCDAKLRIKTGVMNLL